jgi:hypothetical protein
MELMSVEIVVHEMGCLLFAVRCKLVHTDLKFVKKFKLLSVKNLCLSRTPVKITQ